MPYQCIFVTYTTISKAFRLLVLYPVQGGSVIQSNRGIYNKNAVLRPLETPTGLSSISRGAQSGYVRTRRSI